MDYDLKTQWIEALRSGEYQQGIETLHTLGSPDGYDESGEPLSEEIDLYCCLGVLCEISDNVVRSNYHYIVQNFNDAKLKTSLTDEVKGNYVGDKIFGIPENVHDALTKANDSEQSFEEIADWLENPI